MSRKSVRIEQPFQTEVGSVNVGDQVAVMTVCTKRASMFRGKYLGYIESTNGSKRVQVEVEDKFLIYYYKGTNKRFSWSDYDAKTFNDSVELRKEIGTRVATLINNKILPFKV